MSPSAFFSGTLGIEHPNDKDYDNFIEELEVLQNNNGFNWTISTECRDELTWNYHGRWIDFDCFVENSDTNTQLLDLANKYHITLNGQIIASFYDYIKVLTVNNNSFKHHYFIIN